MRDELKKKIEQINMGLTPKGYKKVKFKIVPSEWKCYSIHEVCEVVNGGTPSTKNKEYWNGIIPWCTPTDITKTSKYISKTEKTITEQGLNNSSAVLLPKNSILMTSRATIGPRSINLVEMATNQGFKSFVCRNDKLDYEFFYYLLEIYIPYFRKLGSGSTFIEVSKKDVENTKITIPVSLEEQKLIASILSTWDKAIELKEKLIEQKKEQKKGLMQKLLTGEVRFPGFGEDWKEVKIKDIAEIFLGLTYTPQYVQEGVPFLSVKDLDGDKLNFDNVKYISREEYEKSTSNAKPQKGDMLFGRVGTLGNPVILDEDVEFCIFVSLGFLRMKNEHTLNYFVKYWMESNLFSRQVEAKVAGSSQKNLNTGWLKEFKLILPEYNEQKTIVNVLRNVDKEINMLEQEKNLLTQQKKGLMQLLLTGKVRVKV